MVCGVWILQKYVLEIFVGKKIVRYIGRKTEKSKQSCNINKIISHEGWKSCSIFILLSFDSSIYVFIQNILIICYMFYVNCINLPIIYFRVGKTTSVSIRTPIFFVEVYTHTYCCVTKAPLSSPVFDFIKCFTHWKNLLLSPPGNNTVFKGHIKRISDNDL